MVLALLAGYLGATKGRRAAEQWLARETARRAESALAAALGGRVRVGGAEMRSDREIVLRDVEIEGATLNPSVDAATVAEVRIVVPEGESITGTFGSIERLELVRPAATVRLPLPEPAPAGEAGPAPLRIAELLVSDGSLSLARDGALVTVGVSGEAHDIGGEASADLEVRTPRLDLDRFARVVLGPEHAATLRARRLGTEACCGAATANVTIDRTGGFTVLSHVMLPAGLVADGDPERLAVVQAVGRRAEADGRRDVAVGMDSPGLVQARVRVALDAGGAVRLRSLDGRVEVLPRAWLQGVVPEGVTWESGAVEGGSTDAGNDSVRQWLNVSLEAARVTLPGRAPFDLGRVRLVGAGLLRPDGSIDDADLGLSASAFDGLEQSVILRGRIQPAGESWRVALAGGVTPALLSRLPVEGVPAISSLGAGLRVQGVVADGLDVDLDVARLTAELGDGVTVLADEARVEIRAGRVTAHLKAGVTVPGLGRALVDGTVAAPRAGLERWKAQATVAFEGRGKGEGSLTARGDGRGGGALEATLAGAQVLPWITALAPDLAREAGLARVGLTGAGDATLSASWDARRAWKATARGNVGKVAAESEDHARALALAGIAWSLDASGEAGAARIDAEATMSGAQVLRGAVFADLSAVSPRAVANLRRDAAGAWSGEAALSAGDLGSARASFAPAQDGAHVVLDLACPDLASAWSTLARAGALDGSELAQRLAPRGSVRARLAGDAGHDLIALEGEAGIDGLGIDDPEGAIVLDGVTAALPLRVRRGAEGAPWTLLAGGAPGRLRAGRLDVLGASARDADMGLRIEEGSIRGEAPLPLELLGGTLTLSDLVLRDALGDAPALDASVQARGLQLARLGPVGPFRLEGSVSATFPHVSLSAAALHVDGGAQVLAWGGQVDVGEIAVEEPLSRFPRTRVSATFSEIDLFELTRTIGFGAVTGLAEGSVHDVELLGTTPVRFAARLQTVPREGVPQTLSIPALQNLATLATGGRAPLFDKGMLKLVKTLRYDTLGAAASLQADAFTLRGLAERDGRELFLKGRLPLRVDVANAEPGAVVSFRAMMSRLAGLQGIGDAATP